MLVGQSCLTLCDPVDCSPPGSSVHGILQARVLEWVVTGVWNLCFYLGFPVSKETPSNILPRAMQVLLAPKRKPCAPPLFSHNRTQTLMFPITHSTYLRQKSVVFRQTHRKLEFQGILKISWTNAFILG